MTAPQILLATDTVESAIANNLTQLGYELIMASTSEQAAELLARNRFDLALLDLQLPGMPVIDILERRAADSGSFTPVLVLAAAGEETLALQSIERGAEDFLPLPCNPVVLHARVAAALERQRLRVQEQAFRERERVVKFERDLQIARRIQASFLPETLPELSGWQIAARFQPAREVAGDFYDVFPLVNNRRLGIVIADVCDKGVGAALFMALFRSLLRAFANQNTSLRWMDTQGEDWLTAASAGRQRNLPSTGTTALKHAIVSTNNYIAQTHDRANMFATVFFGMLDPQTGALAYVNGGHEPPVIVDATGIKTRLMPTGPIVGAFPDVSFEVGAAQLDPGDTLVAFTDGVTEAWSAAGELYTAERVYAALARPAQSATALLEALEADVQQYSLGTEPADDITMLAVRRTLTPEPV